MSWLDSLQNTILFAGHYGSGKTNMALNLAILLRQAGRRVNVIDLDIINPYFRLADGAQRLEEYGIGHVAPMYVNTNVDIPALPPQIPGLLDSFDGTLVIDVGGDDTGAAALGGFARAIEARGYQMLLAVNKYRPFTGTEQEAVQVAAEIEQASRLRFTGIAANPNLGPETTAETVLSALPFTKALAERMGLGVSLTAVREDLADAVADAAGSPVLPLQILKKPGWEIW